MTDQRILKQLLRLLEQEFEGNISMIAVSGERALKSGLGERLNIVLKSFFGGELLQLRQILSEFLDAPQIGLFTSEDEIKFLSKDALVPLYTDCRVLVGSKQNIPKVSRSDIRSFAVNMLTNALTELRSQALYTELELAAGQLLWLYFTAASALQLIYYLESGKFTAEFSALKTLCSDRDYVVLDMAQNWDKLKTDRQNYPEDSIAFLENFCRAALERLKRE